MRYFDMNAFTHISYAGKTDVGRKRKNNEDAFGMFPDSGVFCVADGMGGGDDGEIASAAVVKSVGSFAAACKPPPNVGYAAGDIASGVVIAVNESSAWICSRAAERKLKGCGSTFVGICFDATAPSEAIALHAGDSRLYRIRGTSIKQITKDHSAAEMIGAKDENAVNPCFRGVILRAVGIHPSVDVERTPLSLKEGDRIVICSDGLSKMVDDRKIAAIVHGGATPETSVDALIAAANDAGGVDNITAVVLFVGKLPLAMPAISMHLPEPSTDSTEDMGEADTSSTGTGGSFGSDTDTADEPQTIPTMTVRAQKHDVFGDMRGGPIRIPPSQRKQTSRKEISHGRGFRMAAAILAVVMSLVLAVLSSIYLVRRAKARGAQAEAERQRSVKVLAEVNAGTVAEESRPRVNGGPAIADEEPIVQSIERELELRQDDREQMPSDTKCENSQAVVDAVAEDVGETAGGDDWELQVLPRLVKSCTSTNSEALVRTVRRFPVKGGVETLQMRFLPLCNDKLPIARRRAIAAVVTADMQDISRELRRYSERRIAHIDAALSEHATRAEFKKKLAAEREGLAAFLAATGEFVDMDASSSDAQKLCAEVMLGLAQWFSQVN
ncbi:MAG: serine/threonine-protein phosphatase [Kiritimatiellae bacterium]|nr:serine/threonine-protein phosphatase [Kiritimatiellia bacterium]